MPRLSTLLLTLRDGADRDDVPLTHEQLRRLLGVRRRASVTTALHALRSRGIVDTRRAQVQVIDSAALRAVACSCIGPFAS